MREAARPLWRAIGSLLPADVRERVFEPACYERLRRGLEQDRSAVPMTAYALAALVGVAGFNFPRVLFDGRRLSRLGKLVLAGGLVTLAAVWLIVMARYSYPGGGV